MDKVILKAVFSTLMAIIVLCGVMTAALVFIYPSTMMGLAYDVGLDNAWRTRTTLSPGNSLRTFTALLLLPGQASSQRF